MVPLLMSQLCEEVFNIGMGLLRILEETNQEESFLNTGAVDQLILWKRN